MEAKKFSPWVISWAQKKSKTVIKTNDVLTPDEVEQEILLCYIGCQDRVSEIEAEQGQHAAKSYLGMVVENMVKNLRADLSSQLTGMNGVPRKGDSEEVLAAKATALNCGISLNQELGEGEDSLAEVIADESHLPVEDVLDREAIFKAAGILAPILSGEVNHPRDWCAKFPGAYNLLVENPALREMAVRRVIEDLAEICQIDKEFLISKVMDFLEGWRGARGDYGDGDENATEEVEFESYPEMAAHFPEGSALRAIALAKPLKEIPGYADGFGEACLRQVLKEAKEVVQKLSLSDADKEDFVQRVTNYARSYLKAKGGLVKFAVAQERRQQDLF